MDFKCGTCGTDTETCYTDSGALGLVHGMCQCRNCYAKDHPECPNCSELTDEAWKYCTHCGLDLKA